MAVYCVWRFYDTGIAYTSVYGIMAQKLRHIKRHLAESYTGRAHMLEAVPSGWDNMDMLHEFARANPIYDMWYETTIGGEPCVLYEGDISQYMIDSLKNAGSAQPFYPTWLLSAYILVLAVREAGYGQVIDVGSGDGRIAYCGDMLNMEACSIELDTALVQLQNTVMSETGVQPDVYEADATLFEYDTLGYTCPAVFTGGLPQAGDLLADSVMAGMKRTSAQRCGFVLAGSRPRAGLGGIQDVYGWGPLIRRHGLHVQWEVSLPTAWTFDQTQDTPYVCVA